MLPSRAELLHTRERRKIIADPDIKSNSHAFFVFVRKPNSNCHRVYSFCRIIMSLAFEHIRCTVIQDFLMTSGGRLLEDYILVFPCWSPGLREVTSLG